MLRKRIVFFMHSGWLTCRILAKYVLFMYKQSKKISDHFVSTLSGVKLFFGPLINQLG